VIIAILSSNLDISIENNFCFAAEIGLSGEIRPASNIEQRISEADKLGFKKIFISKYNKITSGTKNYNIEICLVKKIEDIFKFLFL